MISSFESNSPCVVASGVPCLVSVPLRHGERDNAGMLYKNISDGTTDRSHNPIDDQNMCMAIREGMMLLSRRGRGRRNLHKCAILAIHQVSTVPIFDFSCLLFPQGSCPNKKLCEREREKEREERQIQQRLYSYLARLTGCSNEVR